MSPDVTEYVKTILHRVGSSRGTAVAGAGSAEDTAGQADTHSALTLQYTTLRLTNPATTYNN